MAHGMINGLDKMASGRKKSVWHMAETDTVIVDDLMTVEEAFAKGLGWEPIEIPLRLSIDGSSTMVVPRYKAIVRDDLATDNPDRILGIVGDGYVIGIGNRGVCEIAAALTEMGKARIDTVGSIRGGQRVYVTAVVGNEHQIKDDTISEYLTVTTGYTGLYQLEGLLSPIRVVCQNTLTAAIKGASHRFKLKHTKNHEKRLDDALKLFSQASVYFNAHAETMRRLADFKINAKKAEEFLLNAVFKSETTKAKNDCKAIIDLFAGGQIGADMDALKGTAYGLANAFTQWIETDSTIRVHGNRDPGEARLDSVIFGSAAARRESMMSAVMEMAV